MTAGRALLATAGAAGAASLVWLAGLAVTGCGAGALGPANQGPDAGMPADADVVPNPKEAGAPRFVVVNGLVDGGTQGLGDVRLCFEDRPGDFPRPDDPTQPMPLSNYPGIARGRGVDLGAITTAATKVYVFDAKALRDDVANGQAQFRRNCGELVGAAGAYAEVTQADQVGDENLLVLVDSTDGDAGAPGIALRHGTLTTQGLGAGDAGLQGTVYGTVSVYADWGPAGTFAVSVVPSSGTPASVASALVPATPSGVAPIATTTNYDQTSLRFESSENAVVPRTFEQSFTDIQLVSDPTTAPSTLYGLRANFAFVVVGDPADTSVLGDGGTDPSFDGRGMHIVAVPFTP